MKQETPTVGTQTVEHMAKAAALLVYVGTRANWNSYCRTLAAVSLKDEKFVPTKDEFQKHEFDELMRVYQSKDHSKALQRLINIYLAKGIPSPDCDYLSLVGPRENDLQVLVKHELCNVKLTPDGEFPKLNKEEENHFAMVFLTAYYAIPKSTKLIGIKDMDVKDVAQALNVSDVWARRLLKNEVINAFQLENSNWVVDPASLFQYWRKNIYEPLQDEAEVAEKTHDEDHYAYISEKLEAVEKEGLKLQNATKTYMDWPNFSIKESATC